MRIFSSFLLSSSINKSTWSTCLLSAISNSIKFLFKSSELYWMTLCLYFYAISKEFLDTKGLKEYYWYFGSFVIYSPFLSRFKASYSKFTFICLDYLSVSTSLLEFEFSGMNIVKHSSIIGKSWQPRRQNIILIKLAKGQLSYISPCSICHI